MENKIRKYKIIPSKSVFCDVDSTLIEWAQPGETFEKHPRAILVEMFGETKYVVPMLRNIETLKKLYTKGYEVVVWSLSSKQWAEYIVEQLGLKDYVDFCVSKPDFFLDDKEVSDFMLPEKRLYHPLED